MGHQSLHDMSDPMNGISSNTIVHVLLNSGRGGIEIMLPGLISAMGLIGVQVYVIRGNATGKDCVFSNTGIQFVKGSSKRLESIRDLYRFARKNRKAIFHGYNLGPVYLLTLWLSGARKVVYSIRGTVYWKKSIKRLPIKLAWYFALLKKPVFISNSHFSAKVFHDKINRRVIIHPIYNPIEINRNTELLSAVQPIGHSRILNIIYVGRLVNGKNLFAWLDVAKYVHDYYPGTKFQVFGQGPLSEKLEDYARGLHIQDAVEFMGFTNDLEAAYCNASLLLFLSEYESFGNVVVESILAGTPVICSDIPSMREIFIDYPEFLVKLDTNLKESVVNKIEQLDMLKVSAQRAKAEFQGRFSMKRYIKDLSEIYASIPD